MKDFFGDEIPKTVFISEEQLKRNKSEKLYGRYFPDTCIFNIFPEELKEHGEFLCDVLSEGSSPKTEGFSALSSCSGLKFFYNSEEIKAESYSLYQDIFSRNKGILETGIMSAKKVVISGCGSVGSLVALELARSGVGSFLLIDGDILEYHNLCRHQCGLEDVGDLKVNALERKIKNINPSAKVFKFAGIIQNIPKSMLDEFCSGKDTIFAGCADNRASDVYINRISMYYSANFISIGFWERACAGELFYHIPGRNMPCYDCAIGDGGGFSAKAQANHHVYSNLEDATGIKFEPGISVDINFITSIGVKLIIDILNSTNEKYIPRLLNNLQQFTLVCNTCNPDIGGSLVDIFSYPLQVTTSLITCFRHKECVEAQKCINEQEEDHENINQ